MQEILKYDDPERCVAEDAIVDRYRHHQSNAELRASQDRAPGQIGGAAIRIELQEQTGVFVLRCRGRFVPGADREYLNGKLEELEHSCAISALANFGEVSSIGSTGVSFVVGVYSLIVKIRGGRFVLVGANHRVREVLDLTGLSGVIQFAEDMDGGLATLLA
jgi:anti-anti-sigma factor